MSYAAANGREAVVLQQLATGRIEVDVKNNNGRTPLSWVAANGREAVVQQQLARGQVEVDVGVVPGGTLKRSDVPKGSSSMALRTRPGKRTDHCLLLAISAIHTIYHTVFLSYLLL